MSTLATALKDEIRRVARKEIKQETKKLSEAVTRYRSDIAALKKRLNACEKKLSYFEGQERKKISEPAELTEENVRFSSRSVKSQRAKTGLSAADYGKLIGVSALTVYNWEQGKSKPRKQQLASLVAIRGIGKREAKAKLELMAG